MLKNIKITLAITFTLFSLILYSEICTFIYQQDQFKLGMGIESNFLPVEFTKYKINIENDAGTGGDAGDTLAWATYINQGKYNGTLTNSDKDYYTFSVSSGTIINASMIPLNLSLNFDLTLYTPESTPLPQNLKDAGIRETIIWSSSNNGNFSIQIAPSSLDNGNYTFSVNLTKQNDFDSNSDAGNSINNPLEIEDGLSNGTIVSGSDENDFYKIALEQGDIISITLKQSNTTNIDIFLYDDTGIEIDNSKKLTGYNETIYHAISITSNHIIQITFIESTIGQIIIHYNLTISITKQNDGNSGTDAGNDPENAYLIIPLSNSIFRGKLVFKGDQKDFYKFTLDEQSIIYAQLAIQDNTNFDLILYNFEKVEIFSSKNILEGANETIWGKKLQNGTYYIAIEYGSSGSSTEGRYALNIGIIADVPTTPVNGQEWKILLLKIIGLALIPLLLILLGIFFIYNFTNIRIPWISNKLDQFSNKEGKPETLKSLKYAIRIRDEQISKLREETLEKDSKRAKDLEALEHLEEDQKIQEKVLTKIREENSEMKTRLDNLQAISDDLANIIDSTIRRQLTKTTKPTQTVKLSSITSLLWFSEERLINYINSIPLLNQRYILDRSRNFILTRDYARELVRQAYWKRVGAMHLKKIKQVKITNLVDDTQIELNTLKEIIRELVERKEIPAPIHMDRSSLLLSISEELINELTEVAMSTPIISLNNISNSYDLTIDSAKVILNKIIEEGYTKGEFITENIFIVTDLFVKMIISEGSVNISKLARENELEEQKEELRILIEKLTQANKINGQFLTEELFLCYNNLTEQLKELIITSIEDISKGHTRRVVFDLGSVLEAMVKEQLIVDLHECDDVSKLSSYNEVIELKELGRILRAAEDTKITLPSTIELKSLNRFWAQKIKHTKPGELPYIPTNEETKEFLFETNKALNKLLTQKIPADWKIDIAEKLIEDNK